MENKDKIENVELEAEVTDANEVLSEDVETSESAEPEVVDPRKNMFVVHTLRDVAMMKTFAKFYTRVKHPRAQFNMIILGIACYTLAIKVDGIKTPGLIVCYVMGTLLIAMAVFRNNMSVATMKKNPEIHIGEELYYFFGRTGVRGTADGKEVKLGNYKDVYRIWEDEFNFFLGFESEDLIVLPKGDFEEGDFTQFCDFILDKTGATYRWSPSLLTNRFKGFMTRARQKMTGVNLEGNTENKSSDKKKEKKNK